MATCTKQKLTGTAERKAKDSEVWTYLFLGDSNPSTALSVIDLAHSTGPDPVPVVGTQLPGRFIFVQTIVADQTTERRDSFIISVNFGPPEAGEDDEHEEQPNPLSRPAVYDLQYIEQEYVIEKARNVEELTGAFTRVTGTLGPIVNAAYRRPDEPIVDTERNVIIVIEKNYPSLGAIMALNEAFQRTCNSDSCNVGGQSIVARRLKYLCTQSLGRQQEGDIVYYPGRTEIELKKTTDLILDNVGYHYWDSAKNDYIRAKDVDGSETADPINLDLGGELNTTSTTTITYRHLEEVAYASFFA